MVVDWALYEKLLGISEDNADARDVAIDGAVSVFVEGIVDDPAYQKDAIVDGESVPIVASRTSTTQCSIKAIPGTDIHIGDMVKCLDEDWIVVELYIDKVGIINGEMWLCNNEIKFQNHSPAINTRFCVVDDGTYSKKSSDPDAFVMANTYKIYISIDDATKQMYVDKRLGFGEIYAPDGAKILEVYKIIGMDIKSKNYGEGSHLMVLTVQRDVYNAETDSILDNICDIFKAVGTTTNATPVGSCSIGGKDIARIGTTRKYTATYTDAEGLPVDGAKSVWSVSAPSGVTYVADNDSCTVSIPLDSQLVGTIITISVSDEGGRYGSFEKKVQVITVG